LRDSIGGHDDYHRDDYAGRPTRARPGRPRVVDLAGLAAKLARACATVDV